MQTINLICFRCKHNNLFEGGCKAFPNGIPDEILESNKHDEPLDWQENDLVFEELPEDDIRRV